MLHMKLKKRIGWGLLQNKSNFSKKKLRILRRLHFLWHPALEVLRDLAVVVPEFVVHRGVDLLPGSEEMLLILTRRTSKNRKLSPVQHAFTRSHLPKSPLYISAFSSCCPPHPTCHRSPTRHGYLTCHGSGDPYKGALKTDPENRPSFHFPRAGANPEKDRPNERCY